MATKMEIKVRYSSIDRCSKSRSFKTLEGARKFAHRYVGESPDVSLNFGYAVSFDGVGKVEWEGCTAKDLFPKSFPESEAQHHYEDREDWYESAHYEKIEKARKEGRHLAASCGCGSMTCQVCTAPGRICEICGRDFEDGEEAGCSGTPPYLVPPPADDGLPF